jgi:hypothetical protein
LQQFIEAATRAFAMRLARSRAPGRVRRVEVAEFLADTVIILKREHLHRVSFAAWK